MLIDENLKLKLDEFFMFPLGPFCQFQLTVLSKTSGSGSCFGQRKERVWKDDNITCTKAQYLNVHINQIRPSIQLNHGCLTVKK